MEEERWWCIAACEKAQYVPRSRHDECTWNVLHVTVLLITDLSVEEECLHARTKKNSTKREKKLRKYVKWREIVSVNSTLELRILSCYHYSRINIEILYLRSAHISLLYVSVHSSIKHNQDISGVAERAHIYSFGQSSHAQLLLAPAGDMRRSSSDVLTHSSHIWSHFNSPVTG